MRLFGSLTDYVASVFKKNGFGITLRPNNGTTYTAARTMDLPPGDTDHVLVSETATQTLTNKTFTTPTINNPVLSVKDTDLSIKDDGDTSKIAKFESSGITTGTTRTFTFPDATTTLVGTGVTQTLTNKTLTSPTINTPILTVLDTGLTIQDNVDNTKQAQFELSGITTGTTRTYTVPDASTTLVGTANTQTLQNKTIDNSNTVTLKDTLFTIQDDGDTSKQMRFQASGITTATTRTLTIPDANTTIVGTDATQTLTNKTLTSPTLTTPSVTTSMSMSNQASVDFFEQTGNGTNKLSLKAADAMAADLTFKLPSVDGSSGQFVKTDGSGNLSFASPAGAQNSALDIKNLELATSVAANALTIAMKTDAGTDPSAGDAVNIAFRSSTESTGSFTVRSVTGALSVVVPSSATLGHASAVAYPIYVYALDNAGTVELAVSTHLFNTERVQSSTTIGAGSTSVNTIYSTTGRSNVPMILIGKLISTQTTAGTWAAVPTVAAVAGVRDCPASNVQGAATNDSASAGFIGEYLTQSRTNATQITLTSSTTAEVTATALTLTAGDWDISALVNFETTGAVAFTQTIIEINTNGTSLQVIVGVPDANGQLTNVNGTTRTVNGDEYSTLIPSYRLSTTGTTLHLVCRAIWTGGTAVKACGFIAARRAR